MQPIRRVDKPGGASTGCLGGDSYLIVAESGG